MAYYLHGVQLIVSPLCKSVQRVKISDSFDWITEEARAEINQSLLEMFGSDEETVFDGDRMYTTQRMVDAIKERVKLNAN